jgi:hypothetical protein
MAMQDNQNTLHNRDTQIICGLFLSWEEKYFLGADCFSSGTQYCRRWDGRMRGLDLY